jgi:peroxiredoxin
MDPHRLLSNWLRSVFPEAPRLVANRTVPAFLLPDHRGWLVSSEELRSQGPYVLTFFHGSWCPSCIKSLRLFESEFDRIHELGADIVACSPETFGFPRKLKAESGFRFLVLSDVDCALSIDLGFAFAVPEEIRPPLMEIGVNLEERHGDPRWLLPIPLTMVVDRKGEVVKAFVDIGHEAGIDGIAAALSGLATALE